MISQYQCVEQGGQSLRLASHRASGAAHRSLLKVNFENTRVEHEGSVRHRELS